MKDKEPPHKPGSGGKRAGAGRKPANYTTRIWVTDEEKKIIKKLRAEAKKKSP